jgi:hypothetical protein
MLEFIGAAAPKLVFLAAHSALVTAPLYVRASGHTPATCPSKVWIIGSMLPLCAGW